MTDEKNAMKIIKPSAEPSNEAPAEYFTGSVRVTPLVKGENPSCLTCASVGFEAGARSAWHTHPKGQFLIVTEGSGLIQEWGKRVLQRKSEPMTDAQVGAA
jgi:quercetin dioxygenase-like cupin family protein